MQNPEAVKVLVLTFNRTLAGYVRSLAEQQISGSLNVDLDITTFGQWAMSTLGRPLVMHDEARIELHRLAARLGALSADYIVKEVEYLLGRFEPEHLENYIAAERTGRGPLPRVNRALRRRILDEVVGPYKSWLHSRSAFDWNDIAVEMAGHTPSLDYDVVIVDETQDFSANQLRAVRRHLREEHAVTFVIDTVQRIYARGFSWAEAGFDVRPERIHVLRANHRNTSQIAAFAAGILKGISVEGDGALPNLTAATSTGPLPIVLRGLYSRQANWAVNYIVNNIDLTQDSVAFLKPQAGAWFNTIKGALASNGLSFEDITRQPDWPNGPENIALSTFHSAKGLEFDHVFILGFNNENTPYAGEDQDDQVFVLRRLLAVAVARARRTVVVGYKPGEESRLVEYFEPGTFVEISI